MTINFEIVRDGELTSATVVIDGDPITVAESHPQWEAISTGLLTKKFEGKEEELRLLVTPALVLDGALSRISERVAFRGGRIYFDGDLVDNTLTKMIIKVINEAGSVTTTDGSEPLFRPLVNFLEKLYLNPSAPSREHLFDFIQSNGINILPDGDFIGYKGVQPDRGSVHAGYGIVDGTVYEHAHLPNHDGAVVEIPRSKIDDNRAKACSVGLHVGKFDYAAGFGPVLLNVKVNPRDVVSVPSENNGWKIRVSRYTVLGLNEGKLEKVLVQDKVEKPAAPVEEVAVEENEDDDDTIEAPVTSDHEKRTKRMVEYIKGLPEGTNLRRVRNKTITAKNRVPFDAALKVLGKTLDG